jgi:hypothetical protein
MSAIVVIEDDPAIRAAVQRSMTDRGHVVSVAATAMAGLELVLQEKPELAELAEKPAAEAAAEKPASETEAVTEGVEKLSVRDERPAARDERPVDRRPPREEESRYNTSRYMATQSSPRTTHRYTAATTSHTH